MIAWHEWSVSRRIVVVVLALAVGWDVSALVRLFAADAPVRAAPLPLPTLPSINRRPLDDAGIYTLAASRSPFGGTAAPPPAPAVADRDVPEAQPRLTGTVMQGDSSFVIIELTDGSMRLVRRGQTAAGYTLRTVSPGVATFTDSSGQRIVLHAATSETAIKP